jgi:hypothetical protein
VSFDPDTTRIVRSWLDEGVTQLPDRVLDAVLDQVPATPQRRVTWWPARRLSTMNTTLKFGLAAVVVAVAALIGINAIGTPSNVGGPGPDPTVESTPLPEPSPSDDAGLPRLITYTPGAGVDITMTVAAPGWEGDDILQWGENGADAPDGAGMISFAGPEFYVYGDPCAWSSTIPETPATTVDEVIDALANQASREASAPEDLTVDGYAGKRIILRMAEGVDFTACEEGFFALLGESRGATVDDLGRYSQDPGQIEELWVVDVGGSIVVMDGVYYPDTMPSVVDELRAILASAIFEVP